MIDISNQKILEEYLRQRKLISDADGFKLEYCKGGVSGTVVYVERPGKPLIIKQALAKLKVKETWLCDPNRMNIEYESNKIYHELMPENAPEVYFYDEENYIFGREAVPAGCTMWKADLLDGLLDFKIAQKAIETMAVVHKECAGDPAVAAKFADKKIFYDLRISPYIVFTVGKHPQLQAYADRVSTELMEREITLVHGDYSPKNIMVVGRGIKVLDYEVAHYGHPAFDLAFFSNHFILKAVKNPQFAQAYLNMLAYMIGLYFDRVDYMDRTELESCYIRTLALLMIARVDGKSPVEYLTAEPEKQELVRRMTFGLVAEKIENFADALRLISKSVGG
ncbi:MAG TPA: phosphotransferase [Firmicutes bacterium]|nr:phosphotransferase [Bacillota bacterium]